MRTKTVVRQEIDLSAYKQRTAVAEDFSELITESTVLLEDGKPIVVYQELDVDTAALVAALRRLNYQTTERTGGLKSTSRIFGYMPRNAVRADFCRVTSLAHEDPAAHVLICEFGKRLAEIYAQTLPEVFQDHEAKLADVIPEYRIEGTPFTSGIVNYNNPLKYHFDAGNFRDVYSNMVVFKQGVEGGYLSLPEFNVGFELKNNSVFLFDGQKILHGVTPIVKQTRDAYRYSIVYYSLQQMWKCQTVDDELIRIRRVKTERERKRKTYAHPVAPPDS